jgi:hypothetical protein
VVPRKIVMGSRRSPAVRGHPSGSRGAGKRPARKGPLVPSRRRKAAPPPPPEGWKLISTSLPHLQDAPWGARFAMAAVEKVALLLGVAILCAGLLVAGMAGLAPSIRAALLRWLLALF